MERAQAALDRGEGLTADAWGTVQACLLDDLNTPGAVAALSEPLNTMNELLVVRKKKPVRFLSWSFVPQFVSACCMRVDCDTSCPGLRALASVYWELSLQRRYIGCQGRCSQIVELVSCPPSTTELNSIHRPGCLVQAKCQKGTKPACFKESKSMEVLYRGGCGTGGGQN
jgi:hypothetical protein